MATFGHPLNATGEAPALEWWAEGQDETERRQVPLRALALEGTVAGPLARLRLQQRFRLPATVQGTARAAYRFALPGDAAVLGVEARFGDAVVRTVLQAVDEAHERFEQASAAGHAAVLVTQEANVFELQLTGLRPEEEVVIDLVFAALARRRRDGWELRLPLTVAPKYTTIQRGRRRNPLAVARDPGYRLRVDLRWLGLAELRETSLPLTATTEADGALRLHGDNLMPNRDLVLRWAVPWAGDRPSLQAFAETHDGDTYLLALATAPAQPATEPVPREIVLLVDGSGSMTGTKWQAAVRAARSFLRRLGPNDRFALGVFDTDLAVFDPDFLPARSEHVNAASRFLDSFPGGGTELGPALEWAMGLPGAPGDWARHVLVITDAQVGNEADVLRAIASRRRRVSVLGIDTNPEANLAEAIAERTGGCVAFLADDGNAHELEDALVDLLAAWEAPLWPGLHLRLPDVADALAAGVELEPADDGLRVPLHDLPSSGSRWVVARLLRTEPPPRVELVAGDGTVLAAAAPTRVTEGGALRGLFGAWRLRALERTRFLLPDGGQADDPATVRAQLVAESLRYGVPCSATAFVGVLERAGEAPTTQWTVPSALPAGWSSRFVTYAPAAPVAFGAEMSAPQPLHLLQHPSAAAGPVFAPSAAPTPLSIHWQEREIATAVRRWEARVSEATVLRAIDFRLPRGTDLEALGDAEATLIVDDVAVATVRLRDLPRRSGRLHWSGPWLLPAGARVTLELRGSALPPGLRMQTQQAASPA